MTRPPAPRASYDRVADTFYLTITGKRPGRYVEDDDGLVWRLDTSGALMGVTVQAYRRIWGQRRAALAEKIAASLHLDEAAIVRQLPVTKSVAAR